MLDYKESCLVEFDRLIDTIINVEEISSGDYGQFCTIHFEEIAGAFIKQID